VKMERDVPIKSEHRSGIGVELCESRGRGRERNATYFMKKDDTPETEKNRNDKTRQKWIKKEGD